ncbi:MAG: DMT family transporter, partial [Candidatus Heimdallarchaeaceae archaeon]
LIGFFNSMAFFFQYLGQDLTTAGKAALFVNFYVIVVPLLSPYFLNEDHSLKVIISAIIGFSGVFLVSTNLNFGELMAGTFLGDMLTFVASVAWTGYILVSKKYLEQDNSITEIDVFFGSIFWSTIFLTPGLLFYFFKKPSITFQFSFQVLFSLLYLVLFCTIGAFLIYLYALKMAKAGESSIFLLLEIVVAFILEIVLSFFFPRIFENVIPGLWTTIGAFMIISAVFIVSINFGVKQKKSSK